MNLKSTWKRLLLCLALTIAFSTLAAANLLEASIPISIPGDPNLEPPSYDPPILDPIDQANPPFFPTPTPAIFTDEGPPLPGPCGACDVGATEPDDPQ